jgi:predicted RNA polymerase sigma factor
VFRIPDNPGAWLMQVAKNHCIDLVRSRKRQQAFAHELSDLLHSGYTASYTIHQLFLDHEIQDSQLRMVFACCHPALSEEDQILLTLQTCSGFGIEEAGNALLLPYETAKKRLQRAKAMIITEGIAFEIPSGPSLAIRLDRVLRVIYLMFNEGYKSSTNDAIIRRDVCEEATRLCLLLTAHPLTRQPQALALVALMCFQAARFEARLDASGEIVLLQDQDRSKWSTDLITLGHRYLNVSATGDTCSEYHFQAMIAYTHLQAPSLVQTDWQAIYGYYAGLAQLTSSPIVLLNKAIVRGQLESPGVAIADIQDIPQFARHFQQNYLFAAALADLELARGDRAAAMGYLGQALALAPTATEKRLMQRKLDGLVGDERAV